MKTFPFDELKAINVVLFILSKVGKINKHKLAKVLYFADQKHLVKYGRPVIGDTYIAMKNGPVPSTVYDGIKSVDNDRYNFDEFKKSLAVKGYNIFPKVDPDMDELSETDIDCILESILENNNLSFQELCDKSHQEAWHKATANGSICIEEIAKEGGASTEMINYIVDSIHDINLANSYGLA